jgi:hypothetical protein
MDKAVEPVERIFGFFFISSDPKQNRIRGTGWLFGTAAAVKTGFSRLPRGRRPFVDMSVSGTSRSAVRLGARDGATQ